MSKQITKISFTKNNIITIKWHNYFIKKFSKIGYLVRTINLITKLFYLLKTSKFKLFIKRRFTIALIRRRRYRTILLKIRLWSLYNPINLFKQITNVLKIFIISRYKRKGKIILHIPWPIRLFQQYKLGIHWFTDLFWNQNYPKIRYFTKSGRLTRLRSQHHKYNWRNHDSITNHLYQELRDILLNRKVRIIKRIRLFIYLLTTKHVSSIKHRW